MPEARPLRDAAKATMQTNSGAGLGTVNSVRSAAMAISAVAIARAGPHMARQSTCMSCSRAWTKNMSPEYEDSLGFHRLFRRHRKRKVSGAEPVFRSFNLIGLARNPNYVPDVAARIIPKGVICR